MQSQTRHAITYRYQQEVKDLTEDLVRNRTLWNSENVNCLLLAPPMHLLLPPSLNIVGYMFWLQKIRMQDALDDAIAAGQYDKAAEIKDLQEALWVSKSVVYSKQSQYESGSVHINWISILRHTADYSRILYTSIYIHIVECPQTNKLIYNI